MKPYVIGLVALVTVGLLLSELYSGYAGRAAPNKTPATENSVPISAATVGVASTERDGKRDDEVYNRYLSDPRKELMSFNQFQKMLNPDPVAWDEAASFLRRLEVEEYDFNYRDLERFNSVIAEIGRITAGLSDADKSEFKKSLAALVNEKLKIPEEQLASELAKTYPLSDADEAVLAELAGEGFP